MPLRRTCANVSVLLIKEGALEEDEIAVEKCSLLQSGVSFLQRYSVGETTEVYTILERSRWLLLPDFLGYNSRPKDGSCVLGTTMSTT